MGRCLKHLIDVLVCRRPLVDRYDASHVLQETRNTLVAAEAKEILICGGMNFETKKVFVNKLDASSKSLKECQSRCDERT